MVILFSGMPVRGRIRGKDLVGTIHVSDRCHRIWFCHDDQSLDGSQSPELYGHSYSWVFCRVDGGFNSDVEFVLPMCVTRPMDVDPALAAFIRLNLDPSLLGLLNVKVKPFAEYNSISMGEGPGMVRLEGSVTTKKGTFPKSVEIRFSRFLRKMLDSLPDADIGPHFSVPSVTDQQLEAQFNKFVAFQSGGLYHLDILRGDDIEAGYKRSNYSDQEKGTLRKSCMTDKLGLLGLYTQNPQVSLACLRSEGGIEARCLLWESEGHRIHDRVYYTDEWVGEVLRGKLRNLGYSAVPAERVTIRLDRVEFEKYPYVDNFFYMDAGRSTVSSSPTPSALPAGPYRVLRGLDGSHGRVTVSG